ncbi:MAG: hypothetical protein GY714_26785 [Desulfobacterales bacterium]|nr:hypothetical protein [Desulfobacterales bacterium]
MVQRNLNIIYFLIALLLFTFCIPGSYAGDRKVYLTTIKTVAHLKTGEEVRPIVHTQYTRDNKYSEAYIKSTFGEIIIEVLKQYSLKQILFSKRKIERQLFRSLNSKYPENIYLKQINITSFNLSKKLQNDLDKISLLIQELKRVDKKMIRDKQELKYLKLNLKAIKKSGKKINEKMNIRLNQLAHNIDNYPLKAKALKEEKLTIQKRIGLLDSF